MNDAERNRQDFPITARIVAEFRREFGPDVAVKWARENGRDVGTYIGPIVDCGLTREAVQHQRDVREKVENGYRRRTR